MTPTWRQIRALNYGTIGRTVHGMISRPEADREECWFDPPGRWRTAVDGDPTLIVTPTDQHFRMSDGTMGHKTLTSAGHDTIGPGGDGRALVAAHLNWPIPGYFDPPSVGMPVSIDERTVHGRRGWQVTFIASPIRSDTQTFVIDAETGLAIAWYTDDSTVEMLTYELDEVFDEELFRWNGDAVEFEDETTRRQRDNESKRQRIHEIAQSVPAWMPTTVSAHPEDGDPRTGALDSSLSAWGPSVMLRRWPSRSAAPIMMPHVAAQTQHRQITDDVWTHELRWETGILTDDEAGRILGSISLQPPQSGPQPGSVGAEGVIYSGPVFVEYGQYYLPSGDGEWSGNIDRAFAGQRNGLAGTSEPSNVVLMCGLHTGTITVTLEIRADRPEPNLDAWEEIVEAPWAVGSQPWLMGFTDDAPGVELPISPGTYRLRYCANNMDAGRAADTGEFIDSYLITVWPSVIMPDQVIKQTSECADYWNNNARN